MKQPHQDFLQLFVDRLKRRSVLTEEEQQAILDLPTRKDPCRGSARLRTDR
jgi:hypothetical protein